MSVTIEDLLRLPCFENASVEAGDAGLKNIVSSISVLEYSEPTNVQNLFFKENKVYLGGELVITGFINIKDDVMAQCESIRRVQTAGDVGLVIYYVGIILPRIDQKVLNVANKLNFPIICMPKNRLDLRYSEVISDVMEAIIRDQKQQKYFVGEMLERISQMQVSQRKMENILRIISDRIRNTVVLTDQYFEILQVAAWPMSAADDAEEAVKVYRNMLNSENPKVTLNNGRGIYIDSCCLHSSRNANLHFFIISDRSINREQMSQSAEVIRLFINIWNNHEGNVGTSELVQAIIKDEPIKMRRLAEIMHIDVVSFHSIWIIFLPHNVDLKKNRSANLMILSMVRKFFSQQKLHFIADIYKQYIIVFFENLKFDNQVYSLAEAFLQSLKRNDQSICLFYQTGLKNSTNAHNAYVLLTHNMENVFAIYPKDHILSCKEVDFAKECAEKITHGEQQIQEILVPIAPLLSDDNAEILLTTLSTYLLDTHLSITDTADMLFVHPNTVKYRLRKINELLNYPVQKLPEMFWLYTALAIKRILEQKLNLE